MLFVITLRRFLLLFANNYTPTSSQAQGERKKEIFISDENVTNVNLSLSLSLSHSVPGRNAFPPQFPGRFV